MFSMIVSRSFQPLAKNLWLGGYSGHQADQKNQLGMESMTLVRVAGKFEKCWRWAKQNRTLDAQSGQQWIPRPRWPIWYYNAVAPSCTILSKTLWTIGGKAQNCSSCQFNMNESRAIQVGSARYATHLGNWLLSLEANRSTWRLNSKSESAAYNLFSFNFHSMEKSTDQDWKSASILSEPAIWAAER